MEKLRILLLTQPQSDDLGSVEKPDLDDDMPWLLLLPEFIGTGTIGRYPSVVMDAVASSVFLVDDSVVVGFC